MALLVSFASPKIEVGNKGLLKRTAPGELTKLITKLNRHPYQPVEFLAKILDGAGYGRVYADAGAKDLLDQVARNDLSSVNFKESFDRLCSQEGWFVRRFSYKFVDPKTRNELQAFVVVAAPENMNVVAEALRSTEPKGEVSSSKTGFSVMPSGGDAVTYGGARLGGKKYFP